MSLTNEQKIQVSEIIEKTGDKFLSQVREEGRRSLSLMQVIQVSGIAVSVMSLLIAVASFAGYFIVEGFSKSTAERVAKEQLSSEISRIAKLREDIVLDIVPSGAVVPFEIQDGCPKGWIEHVNARSRVIVGATPEGGMADGLKPLFLNQKGGEETYTIEIGESPLIKNYRFVTKDSEISVASGDDHRINILRLDNLSGSYSEETHNHRPPFLSLLFCRKQ